MRTYGGIHKAFKVVVHLKWKNLYTHCGTLYIVENYDTDMCTDIKLNLINVNVM
jgi:hypothetical protein